MSSPAQRGKAAVVTYPDDRLMLTERLERAGIAVPDQTHAKRMMEAARLGLPLNVSQSRIDIAWFRRLFSPRWKRFAVEKFVDPGTSNLYGGMPYHIAERVNKIRAAIPDEKLYVHAKLEDPWLVTEDGVILLGWINGYVVT